MLKFDINNKKGGLKIRPLLAKAEKIFKKDFKNPAVVSLAIVDEKDSKKLNFKYRGKAGATDVLTFVYNENELAGEIVLCYKKIRERAKLEGKTIPETTIRLIVHGLLHILGFNHKNDKTASRMEKKERAALKKIIKSKK